MDNRELYDLLVEAADMLSNDVIEDDFVLTEAAGNSEGKELVNDIKDAINKKDDKKLRTSLAKFKKWFLTADPDGKHEKLRLGLVVIYALLAGVASGASIFGVGISAAGLLTGNNKVKWLLLLIASFTSFTLVFKSMKFVGDETDKVQGESIDEFIKKYEKKVKELKKTLDKYDANTSVKEYKATAKAYTEAVQWLDWFKSRKDQITKSNNIRESKQELKDAKKSKDREKIAKAKAKYKAAKSLMESALAILEEESLNESVGVKDKSTDEVIKVFKNNAEAANWIAENGGNDKYQLTNRLK